MGARGITLEPCEVTTCVKIKKIGPWWLSNVESNIIEPAEYESNDDMMTTNYIYMIY